MRISDWSSDVCSSDLTAAYRDRSAAVLLDRDAALPRLRGDRRMFTQMVMNLLSNAIKYSPGRGEVRVAGAVAEDGSFRLSISDTGIEIGRASCRARVCQYV